MDSDASPASEAPGAGPDGSCPFVNAVVSGVMVSFPAPPRMLSAFWFPLLPAVSASLPLGFYEICHDISSGWSRY